MLVIQMSCNVRPSSGHWFLVSIALFFLQIFCTLFAQCFDECLLACKLYRTTVLFTNQRADLKHPKLQFEMKQKTHYKLQSAKSMKQNIHKCHKDQPKTCKTLSPRIYKSKILFLREREKRMDLGL